MVCVAYELSRLVVDIVVLRQAEGSYEVLLAKRAIEPCKGMWTVPGGHLDQGERFDEAASRELREETGIFGIPLERIGVFDAPDRDPRSRAVSVAYVGIIPKGMRLKKSSEASEFRWWPAGSLPEMGFDHAEIVAAALRKAGFSRA